MYADNFYFNSLASGILHKSVVSVCIIEVCARPLSAFDWSLESFNFEGTAGSLVALSLVL